MPGCFDRAIREDSQCACLFNHNPDAILGRVASGTLKLSTDRIGLAYVCDPPECQLAKHVTLAVERGDVTGSSFAFDVMEQVFRWVEGEEFDILIREVVEVRLWDVAPVVYPAYSATTVGLSRDSQVSLIKQRLERSVAKPASEPSQRTRLAMAKRKLQIAQHSR